MRRIPSNDFGDDGEGRIVQHYSILRVIVGLVVPTGVEGPDDLRGVDAVPIACPVPYRFEDSGGV